MFVPKDLFKKSEKVKTSFSLGFSFQLTVQKFLFLPLGPQELRRRQFHVVSDVPLVVISYLSRDLHVPLEWMKILIYELANRKK